MDHHFVELPAAERRAQDRRGRELIEQHLVLVFVEIADAGAGVAQRGKDRVQRIVAARGPWKQAALRVFERFELVADQPLADEVVDAFGRELFLDESGDAERCDARVIAGADAESEPVQRVRGFVNVRARRRIERPFERRTRGPSVPAEKIVARGAHVATGRERAAADREKLAARKAHGVVTATGVAAAAGATARCGCGERCQSVAMNAPNPLMNANGMSKNVPRIGITNVSPSTMPPRRTRRHGSCSSRVDFSPSPIRSARPDAPKSAPKSAISASPMPMIFTGVLCAFELIMSPSVTIGTSVTAPSSVVLTGAVLIRSAHR